MRRALLWGSLAALLGSGCAGRVTTPATSSSEPPPAAEDGSERSEGLAISPTAARIYVLGEQRYAEGRFDEAVALWGHTMLQLPADPSADDVRHKLVARMAYGLLQAHAATGDPSYLHDGLSMCELYVAKHEELFGDGEQARAQRGDIYELLYEFDSRLDAPVEPPPSQPVTVAKVTTEGLPASEPEVDAEPEPVVLDDGEQVLRDVLVRRISWADEDDPHVRAFILDDRFNGPSGLDHGRDQVHESRVLVRAGALPQPAGSDAPIDRRAVRRAGLAVIEAVRPGLQRCYERAVSREPVMAARVSVTLKLRTDGTVAQAHLTDGTVVDTEGDACVAGVLHEARIDSLPGPLQLSVPIHFFFQDATLTAELFRRERPVSGRAYELTSRTGGLMPIELFVDGDVKNTPSMYRARMQRSSLPDPGEIRR
ncbi:MAG: hypothetical protein AB1Z98_17525 [Nannocystaceae bacterium]